MPTNQEVLIIGAGPAGIGVGLSLDDEATVIEQGERPGGICRSIHWHGAVFDIGGHSFHTPHPDVRDLVFSAVEMYTQPRHAVVATHGSLISYPFQKHFNQIPDEQVVSECETGLAATHETGAAAHFEDYLQQRFGAGIAKHFLLPYNRKLWGEDLTRLAADWAGERVAASAKQVERFEVTGGRRRPLQSNTSVAYPAQGGFDQIVDSLADRLSDLRLNQQVQRIDTKLRQAHLQNGDVLSWNQLVSTMPIDRLLSLIPTAPQDLIADAARLEALPLELVLIVVGHSVDTPIQRIYSADPACPAHKIAINHNSSPYLRSLPNHAILGEVSAWREKPRPQEGFERAMVRSLESFGVIRGADDVVATKTIAVPKAYPAPTHDRDAIVTRIKTWLGEQGIYTVGRFGEWAYINCDEALHRGLRLGRELADGQTGHRQVA